MSIFNYNKYINEKLILENLREMRFVLSKNFINILSKMEHEISDKLIELHNDLDSKTRQTFIDIHKDKDNVIQKNEILYTEIKNIQNKQITKYAEIKVKDHEIQYKMVGALKDSIYATNNMTIAFNKLMTKL